MVKRFLFFVIALNVLSCSKKTDVVEPREKILAKIGSATISVDEFIRRAEYTVRPPYCRGNQNLDKKIVMNSLIAEKLFSIEAGDTNSFIQSDRVQRHLQGRKEQNMRQLLYEQEARNKAVIDTAQAVKTARVAGRKYRIFYFSASDSARMEHIKDEILATGAFESVYFKVTGLDTLPQREVEWSKQEHDKILDSLFSAPLQKNQVVGPIKISNQQYMLIKVNGWIDRPAITQSMSQERWRNITDEFTERASTKLYDDFIRKVMKSKKIEFNPSTMYKIIDLMGPRYFKTAEEKARIQEQSLEKQVDDRSENAELAKAMEQLYDEPFFKVDNQVWTVKMFTDELMVHPLVFREQKFPKQEFGKQLQLAIMDMVRDRFLAEIAYERGYDRINVVQRNVNMFKDNINYQYQKTRYLHGVVPDTVAEMNYIPLIEKYLNPYVDSLQRKYSDQIYVDVAAFNEIRLTRIDLSVTQENVPFPQMVPSFPLVTTDNALDYGHKMK